MIAAVICLATYAALAVGRVPFVRLRRSGAAAAGAVLMIVSGALPLAAAVASIDLRTILLLFAMMLLVAAPRVSGVFTWLVRALSEAFHHPAALLAAVVVTSAVLSAIFINDTICIVFTPVVVELAEIRHHRPLPYLLALATSSNIGSVATIIGNPQNILIGSVSRIPFWDFARALAPVALVGCAADVLVIWLLFRGELHRHRADDRELRPHRTIDLGAITLRAVLQAIDWKLLVLFAGLFVVVAGAERAGVDHRLFELLRPIGIQTLGGLSATAAVLSNVVSNVPAVMLFVPLVPHAPQPRQAWLTLAMASTLAGNLTILGSIANLIVVEGARRAGVEISFGEYARVGVPLTIVTIAFGAWWLS